METIQETGKINYILKEKFLLVGLEQRINRSRFFTRSVVVCLGILVLCFLVALFFQFIVIDQTLTVQIVSVVTLLLQNALFFYFFPILIIKRCHDFDNTGKNYSIIYKTLVGFLTLVAITSLFMDSTIIPFAEILIGLQLLSVALQLYLLLKSGMKGNNQYGPDDSNVKLDF